MPVTEILTYSKNILPFTFCLPFHCYPSIDRLFMDDTKLTPSVRKHLRLDSCGAGEVCAQVKPYDKIIDGIKDQTKISGAGKIWVRLHHL